MVYTPIRRGQSAYYERRLNEMLQELFGVLGTTSTDNSTSVALGSGATFTGTAEQNDYSDVMVSCQTDNTGTLYFDFSVDGTNWTTFPTGGFAVASGIHEFHTAVKGPRYFRVRLVNDTGAQSYLRLNTYFGSFRQPSAPVNQALGLDSDAILTRPTNPSWEAVLGKRTGVSVNLKFGYNDDVDAASPEVVASFGGTFTPLSSAETLDIVSSSASDDGSPAGVGAQTLLISGIDANRKSQTEVVTMNGTTTVTTSNSWLGVNRVVVLAAGTSQGNVGDISITATTATTNQAYIPAGKGVTQQCIFFVQSGYNGLISQIVVSCLKLAGGGTPRVTVKLKVWNPGVTNAVYELRRLQIDTSSNNFLKRGFDPPLLLSSTDVAWLEAETDTNNTIVDANMDIVEIENA